MVTLTPPRPPLFASGEKKPVHDSSEEEGAYLTSKPCQQETATPLAPNLEVDQHADDHDHAL